MPPELGMAVLEASASCRSCEVRRFPGPLRKRRSESVTMPVWLFPRHPFGDCSLALGHAHEAAGLPKADDLPHRGESIRHTQGRRMALPRRSLNRILPKSRAFG